MNATRALRATGGRSPLIQFLGKRSVPESIDHTPRKHPQDPHSALPNSFAEYRARAQQHGPLTGYRSASSSAGSGKFQPRSNMPLDRNELPKRFWRLPISSAEIEAVQSGGAL